MLAEPDLAANQRLTENVASTRQMRSYEYSGRDLSQTRTGGGLSTITGTYTARNSQSIAQYDRTTAEHAAYKQPDLYAGEPCGEYFARRPISEPEPEAQSRLAYGTRLERADAAESARVAS